MKNVLSYISAVMLGTLALSSCDDNFERPPMIYPTAENVANTTVTDLKTKYWSMDRNYVQTVGSLADFTGNNDDQNKDVYISGRVVSESEPGNVYNSIVLQQPDGTALNVAVRTNKLEKSYPFGQEVIINVTGLKIGGYNGLMQLGAEGTYNGAPSMTFMESADFEKVAELNGQPDAAAVDTLVLTLDDIADKSQANLIKYQSQLVRFDNLTFEEPGKTFSANGQTTNRYAKDANGKRINVRTSAYASFADQVVPAGTGSVVGILSYYGTDWQLLLNNITGVIGFDGTTTPDDPVNPPTPPTGGGDGTEAAPFTVAQVIGGASGTGVWAKGYIVGWVEGQVLAEGAKFDATNVTAASNILIAETADCKDVTKCVPVQLPSGTDARTKLNLKDNAGNLGKEVALKGDLAAYFGTAGIKAVSDFKLDGQSNPDVPDTPAEPVTSLNEGFEGGTLPAGWKLVKVSGDKDWYFRQFNENYYATVSGYQGKTPPFDAWLITPGLDLSKMDSKVLTFATQVNGYGSTTSKFQVFVLSADDPSKQLGELKPAVPTAPASGYSEWVESGNLDLSSYSGVVYIGFRYEAAQDANYATWCVDNIKLNVK
ncbi:MAG: DUF5689 domain-containing protein [Muribaculaceae bacterium]